MVFKRYSSPFLFLNKLLENHKFSSGIDTIYSQKNEDKLWELYLSLTSIMSINGTSKSFQDWKSEIVGSDETTTNEIDLEVAKNEAKNILKNFKPE